MWKNEEKKEFIVNSDNLKLVRSCKNDFGTGNCHKRTLIFTLALGTPSCFHELVINTWKSVSDTIDIALITDEYNSWAEVTRKANASNVFMIQERTDHLINSSLSLLGFRNATDMAEKTLLPPPTTAYQCNQFRPLYPLIYRSHALGYKRWGWMDADVMLSNGLSLYLQQANSNLILFPSQGAMWEHIKIFDVHPKQLLSVLKDKLAQRDDNRPLDVMLVYHLAASHRRLEWRIDNFDDVRHLAVHWRYLDVHDSQNHYKKTVEYRSAHGQLADVNGTELFAFIADTESKRMARHKCLSLIREVANHGSVLFPYYSAIAR